MLLPVKSSVAHFWYFLAYQSLKLEGTTSNLSYVRQIGQFWSYVTQKKTNRTVFGSWIQLIVSVIPGVELSIWIFTLAVTTGCHPPNQEEYKLGALES